MLLGSRHPPTDRHCLSAVVHDVVRLHGQPVVGEANEFVLVRETARHPHQKLGRPSVTEAGVNLLVIDVGRRSATRWQTAA